MSQLGLDGADFPVPLVRIPHPVSLTNLDILREVDRLVAAGFSTVFVLSGIDQDQIDQEFERFDSDHLIFLNSVIHVATLTGARTDYFCDRRFETDGSITVRTSRPNRKEVWRIQSRDDVSLAYLMKGKNAIPLAPHEAIVHAFLPTLETAGIGVRINGDFSTDPSRTRIVLDEHTNKCIDIVTSLVCDTILDAIEREDEARQDLLSCLRPNVDEISLRFQNRSFKSELVAKLQDKLSEIRSIYHFAPAWLNRDDSVKLELAAGKRVLPSPGLERSALGEIVRFAGAPTLSTGTVYDAAVRGDLSTVGCAELVAAVLKSVVLIGVSYEALAAAPIWSGDSGTWSLSGLIKSGERLNSEFMKAVVGQGVDPRHLREFVEKLDKNGGSIFPDSEQISTDGAHSAVLVSGDSVSVVADRFAIRKDAERATVLGVQTKWRSAENLVAELLEELGFRVEDHSRQNVGYDILALKGDERLFIEVKSLSYAGQPFALTPYEDSCARDFGPAYVLALVLRSEGEVSVQLISDPRGNLEFVKQCRQWAWECVDYVFDAQYSILEERSSAP